MYVEGWVASAAAERLAPTPRRHPTNKSSHMTQRLTRLSRRHLTCLNVKGPILLLSNPFGLIGSDKGPLDIRLRSFPAHAPIARSQGLHD
jgi:hypothetical protein